MEENQDGSEVLETTETVEETAEAATEETPEELRARITELEGINTKTTAEKAELESKNKQLFERVKKAEAARGTASSDNDLSPRDVAVLLQNNVPTEDFDDVVQAARILNKPLSEALKSNVVKTLIAEKAEERRTANATQTRASARGSSKISGEDLLIKAERTGELPDTDEGMAALVAARQGRSTRKKG